MEKRRNTTLLIIVWIFIILIFVFCSIVIIFTAQGFRYNFEKRKIEKTGLIYIRSEPRDAEVYLNNKLHSTKTPSRIRFLFPGPYDVLLKRKGYQDWKKTIWVQEEIVNFEAGVLLFFENYKNDTLLRNKINIFSTSPDFKNIIYTQKDEDKLGIYNYNLDSEKSTHIFSYSLDKILQPVAWLQDSTKIIFKDNSRNFYIINPNYSGQIYSFSDAFKMYFDSMEWKKNSNDVVIAKSQDQLYILNINKNEKKLIDSQVIGYSQGSGQIFYIKKNSSVKKFYIIKSAYSEKDKNTLFESEQNFTQIYASFNNDIAISDNLDNLFLLIKDGGINLKNLGQKIKFATWSAPRKSIFNFFDESKLSFGSGTEIWTYDKDKDIKLVTRFSESISKLRWFADQKHLIYILKNELYIMERDGTNTTFISKISMPWYDFNDEGKNIIVLNNDILQNLTIR